MQRFIIRSGLVDLIKNKRVNGSTDELNVIGMSMGVQVNWM